MMKFSLKASLFAPIAILSGVVVLLGYFIELPILTDLRLIFLQWAVILFAVAVLVGVGHLTRLHWRRIKSGQTGKVYSFILIFAFVLTLFVTLFFGLSAKESLWIYNNILIPIETSLLALLAIILPYAAARMFFRNPNLLTLVFISTVLVVLVGGIAFPFEEASVLEALRAWVAQVWALGGARGILLGVALGAIATGLRVLMGADRPYEGG